MIGPLLVAEEHRRYEADARVQERYYQEKSDEEKQLADLARKAW